jgi:beta-lactam-binding protein with PASTA domain
VPDVSGDRLDVAKTKMDDAGYKTEEVGGGAFGVVVESNWTVCETDPPAGTSAEGKVRLVIDRSCAASADSDSSGAASSGVSEPELQEVAPDPTPEPTPKPKKKKRPKPAAITVPAVVGMDHQAAQNRMQAAGLYNLRERDATGQGRLMIWDRNWVVVRQSPAPGAPATEATKVTLFSVKDGEQ